MAEITAYLTHVINKTTNDLGRCGPLSNVYESLLVAGCNRVVDPFVSVVATFHLYNLYNLYYIFWF